MGIRARLILWIVALATVSSIIAWIAGSNATTRSTQGSLERRSAILGKAIQSAEGIGALVESNQRKQLSEALANFARADQDIEFVLLTNGRQEVLGWAVTDERSDQAITTAESVQAIADQYYDENTRIDAPELTHNVPMVFEIADVQRVVPKPAPKPAEVITPKNPKIGKGAKAKNAKRANEPKAEEPAEAAPPQEAKTVVTSQSKHTLQSNLLVVYKPHARQLFSNHSKTVIFASLIPFITFIGVLLFFYMGNLASRLDFLRRYTLGLAGGDLTQPFVERGERASEHRKGALR